LTLAQHPHDEDLKPREVRFCLEIEPPWAWYFTIIWTFLPRWFCCRSSPLIVMNLKLFMKVFRRMKTPSSLLVFNFQRWTLLLIAQSNSLIAS
jgi:hypothetical protein